MTSGLMLAATPERFDWMKSLLAKGKYAGGEARLVSAEEAYEMMPLLDPKLFVGQPVANFLPEAAAFLRLMDFVASNC
jgi:hypothetical protein